MTWIGLSLIAGLILFLLLVLGLMHSAKTSDEIADAQYRRWQKECRDYFDKGA